MVKKATILLFIILLALVHSGWSQSLMAVQEIQLKPRPEFHNTTDSAIVFPIFLGSPFTKNINAELLEYLNSNLADYKFKSVAGVLDSLKQEGLGESTYEVFRSRNTISVRVWMGWYGGAHPSYTDDYFTFSSKTGHRLNLDSLLIGSYDLKLNELIEAKKESYLEDYEKELEERVNDPEAEFTKDDFNWAMDKASKNCFDDINFSDFKITDTQIAINLTCGFPHFSRSFSPYKDLIFEKEELTSALKEDFQ